MPVSVPTSRSIYHFIDSAHLLHLIIYYYYFGLGFVVGTVWLGLVRIGSDWSALVVTMVWIGCGGGSVDGGAGGGSRSSRVS